MQNFGILQHFWDFSNGDKEERKKINDKKVVAPTSLVPLLGGDVLSLPPGFLEAASTKVMSS